MKFSLSKNKNRHKKYLKFFKSNLSQTATVQDIIDFGARLMQKARIHHHFFADYKLSSTAAYLTFNALNLPYEYQNSKYLEIKLKKTEIKKIITLFEQRISQRIPTAYLTNEAFYLGNTFYVNENVLVPRSIMSTRFNDFLKMIPWENYRVLDLCTGSGCIGITLALMFPNLTVDLADISSSALAVAKHNIDKHQLKERVYCINSDIFSNITEKYDLIITNPPYITNFEYFLSPKEFKVEPKLALTANQAGTEIINNIIIHSKKYLNNNGMLIAEVGFNAAKRIKKRFPKTSFTWYKYRRPSGKESFFGQVGVFSITRNKLP